MKNTSCARHRSSLATNVTLGIGAGCAIGAALESIEAGVAFGAAGGLLFGLFADRSTPQHGAGDQRRPSPTPARGGQ